VTRLLRSLGADEYRHLLPVLAVAAGRELVTCPAINATWNASSTDM
jgi:hypothetical protein